MHGRRVDEFARGLSARRQDGLFENAFTERAWGRATGKRAERISQSGESP